MGESIQRCGRCKEDLPVGGFSPSYRGKPGTWCRTCFNKWNRGERDAAPAHPDRICAACSAEFTPPRAHSFYCSIRCKNRAQYLRKAEAHRAHSKRAAARKTAARIARTPQICRHCGSVVPTTRRVDARFCTKQCQRAAHKATWSRDLVAARDGWICRICWKPVDANRRYPHPLSPSVDHILPVSRGGDHELANLRLAHLVCNQRRNDDIEKEYVLGVAVAPGGQTAFF